MNLSIDAERLQREIDQLAGISEVPPPVVTRVLFSEADLKARAYVKDLCREIQLTVRQDAVGNLFARWPGKGGGAAVASGSHIDAIPNAGKYDGVVGTLGALEALRALKRSGFQPLRAIELIVFTAEEPTRFGLGCLGSRLLAGTLSSARIAALRDPEGMSLEWWRQRAGLDSGEPISVQLPQNAYAAFIELHIEQGPVLEQCGAAIGIVEKIAAPSSLRLLLTGQGGHAGAVLMPGRHDALLAGAEVALRVEQAALASGSPDTVATTGVFRIEPGAVNSIPCRAALEIDVRDTELRTRNAALQEIERAAEDICQRRGVGLQRERINVDAPAVCDGALVERLSGVCEQLELKAMRMISRAYHDSLFMARICPTAMIFIPSRNGISHRPDEYSSPEQIAAGVAVLAEALRELAGGADS